MTRNKMKKRYLLLALAAAVMLLCAVFGAACSDEVKLSFEANGGTPVAEITATAGESVTLPSTTKSGSAFDGWYTTSDFSGERFEGTISAPDKSVKYYAKWVTGYEVKLDPDGGALTTASLWLKEGANVYEAVKALVPVKSGLSFGAWFLDEAELSRSFRMPAQTVTLTAKYKVGYTIEIYLQNLSRNSYQRNDALETAGSGYVNASVTPAAPVVENYTLQPSPDGRTPVATRTLTENAGENVYSLYYDRNEYLVVYNGNPPAGTEVSGSTPHVSVVYGGTTNASDNGFTAEGYRFAGWATSPSGDIAYLPGQQVQVSAPVTLYAVWDKGFTDRFGGDDLIYFPRTAPQKAILWRNGVEFEGTRDGNAFSFTTKAGETYGGVVIGGEFCYERQDVKGEYVFYDNYPRPADDGDEDYDRYDRSRTLKVTEYLDAVYTENGIPKNGSLVFSPSQGDYLFTSDDGTTSFHTIFQKPADGSPEIFSVSGDEFGYFVDSNGEVMVLDGYGTAFLQITLTSGYQVTIAGSYYKEGFERLWDTYDAYKVVCWLNDTSGVLTGTAGWQVYYLVVVPGYWEELGRDYGMYFFADTSRGVYENSGERLVLDGHGQFSDSAVYTDADGKVTQGPYRVSSDFVSGSVAELLSENGEEVLKRFHLSSDGSFSVYGGPEVPYTEYYLLEGEAMQPVLLALFEEEYEKTPGGERIPGSMRAEFYANNSRGVSSHAGSGYVTYQPVAEGSSLRLYTFTRTLVEYGFSATVPESMRFIVTVVETSSGVRYNTYCVLEREGRVLYERIRLPDGGLVWANPNVEIEGEGSIYFLGGETYYCSFFTYRDTYFNDYYGEVSYVGAGGATSRLYVLTASGEDGIDYTAKEAAGLPAAFSYFDPGYSPVNGVLTNLVLAPDGRADYDEGSTGQNWQNGIGIYRPVEGEDGQTVFGAQVYELVIGGEPVFRFVLGSVNFLGITYDGYFREVGKGGAYQAEDGGTLLLDGYGTGRYVSGRTVLTGSYYFMTNNILRLTEEDGSQHEFELDGEEFAALDNCYGTWNLVDGNFFPFDDFPVIYFDGKGTYIITSFNGNGDSKQGLYELVDEEHEEYVLYQAEINGKKGNYYVRFMEYVEYDNYNCVVRDRASGVYVDEHDNVLSLNGFGSGSIKGNTYNSMGNFRNIDEAYGFGAFEFTTSNTAYEDDIVHLLLDFEKGTFRILEETEYYKNYLYIASDLDQVAFRDDGAAFIGNLVNGDYLITDTEVRLYEEVNFVYEVYRLPLPGANVYEYNKKTYYLYSGEEFTAEGKILMLDKDGKPQADTPEVSATVTFGVRPRSFVGFETSFTIGKEEYGGFLLYSYTGGKIDPRLEYNNLVYNIDFVRQGDKWTFTVTDGGVRVFTRNDNREPFYDGAEVAEGKIYSGGKIDVTYNGFGGYELEKPTYSGKFYYCYNRNAEDKGLISFENLPASEVRRVGYHNLGSQLGGYRNLYEIVFEHGDKKYAIDFFEYNLSSGGAQSLNTYHYLLYGFSEYEEAEAGEYKLGVKYLLRTNLAGSPGYGDAGAVGKPVSITLLGGEKKDTPVVAVSMDVRYENKGVWLVENDQGRAGAAYLISFEYSDEGRVLSGTVQKGSVQVVGLSATYNFYLFVKENGDVGEIMAARYGDTLFMSVEEISQEGDVWTFRGQEDANEPVREYTLVFEKGVSGTYTVTVDAKIIEEP